MDKYSCNPCVFVFCNVIFDSVPGNPVVDADVNNFPAKLYISTKNVPLKGTVEDSTAKLEDDVFMRSGRASDVPASSTFEDRRRCYAAKSSKIRWARHVIPFADTRWLYGSRNQLNFPEIFILPILKF